MSAAKKTLHLADVETVGLPKNDNDAPEPPPGRFDDDEPASAVKMEPTPAEAWPSLDVSGIFAPLESVNYLLAPLDLCPGAPALVAGYGFTGKTVALQSAAVSIAAGLPVWGTFAARQGRALHVDYEQGSRLTRERYQRLAMGLMVSPDELAGRLELVSMPQVYLDGTTLEDFFSERFAGFDLVLIDSLRASCPSLEENDSAVRSVLDMLNRVSGRTGACIVVIHHCRKPQKEAAGGAKMAIRGSGAIFDACGSVLVLEADKGQPTRVTHEKARTSGRCADDFLLRISDVDLDGNSRGGLIVSAESGPAGSSATGSESALDSRVLETVKAHPGVSGRHVWSTLPGTRRENVLNSLARLEMAERVVGKPGPKRSTVWHAVEGEE